MRSIGNGSPVGGRLAHWNAPKVMAAGDGDFSPGITGWSAF